MPGMWTQSSFRRRATSMYLWYFSTFAASDLLFGSAAFLLVFILFVSAGSADSETVGSHLSPKRVPLARYSWAKYPARSWLRGADSNPLVEPKPDWFGLSSVPALKTSKLRLFVDAPGWRVQSRLSFASMPRQPLCVQATTNGRGERKYSCFWVGEVKGSFGKEMIKKKVRCLLVKKVKRFAKRLPERSSGKVCEEKQKPDHKSTSWKAVRTVAYGRPPVNNSRRGS